MRGQTTAEGRTEQLQAWTFLGLLADDVMLAAIRYPELTDAQRHAVERLTAMVSPPDEAASTRRPVIPRRRSMSDPWTILYQAAAIAQHADRAPADDATHNLDFIRGPLQRVLEVSATTEDVDVLRGFAEVLANVTLSMTEQISNEKGSNDWMPRASTFSLK